MGLELCIFDLDGTLIDSRADLARSTNRALAALGLPQQREEEIHGFIGEGARRLVERAAPPGTPPDVVEALLAAFLADYGAHLLDTTVLYPGIREVLAGPPRLMAVATNKPGELSRRILTGLNVGSRFERVIGGDEAERKPSPDGVLRILADTGVRRGHAALVGDSAIDVATARAAGVRAIAVGWGLGRREAVEAARPDFFVATTADLGALLARLSAP